MPASRSASCSRWRCWRRSTWAGTSRSRPASSSRPVREGHGQVRCCTSASCVRRAVVIDRGERLLRRTIGAFVVGLALNCAYGVAQLAAQVGGGVNLDRAPSARSRSARAASAASTSTARRPPCRVGQLRLLGRLPRNALALDPNHLGIMLCVPILLLLPFALRAGIRCRRGLLLAPARVLRCVEVLDALALGVLRPGAAGSWCWRVPLRRQTAARRACSRRSRARSACSPSRRPVALRPHGLPLRRDVSATLGQGALPVLRPRPARARRASRASASA